jgi:hypothetical protein
MAVTMRAYGQSPLLSGRLAAVLDALPDSIPKPLISDCRSTVRSQAVALDDVQAAEEGTQVGLAANLATRASKLIFGERAITSASPLYESARQSNW